PGGEPTSNIARLVSDPLRARLLHGLESVRATASPWQSEALPVSTNSGLRHVILRAEPIVSGGLTLVVFEEETPGGPGRRAPAEAAETIAAMEGELGRLQRRLQGALGSRHEHDLTSLTRTELKESTEELDAVLEELSTSREELQAVNEELVALDDE